MTKRSANQKGEKKPARFMSYKVMNQKACKGKQPHNYHRVSEPIALGKYGDKPKTLLFDECTSCGFRIAVDLVDPF